MKRNLLTTILLVMIIFMVGCSGIPFFKSTTPADEIYVEYDGGMITKTDFDTFVQSLTPEQQESLNMAGKQVQLLNSMAREEAFYAKAIALGYDKDPEVLNLIETRLKPYYIQEFYQQEIREKATITDEEALAYYNENPDFFEEPAKATIRYIQAKDLEASESIMSDLKDKELDFEIVSRVKSINEYAKGNNGIIREIQETGYVQGVGTDPELNSLIFSLEVNDEEYYGPFETETGIHIFSILNRTESFVKPYSQVEELAHNRAKAVKQKQISDDLLNQVKLDLNIEIHKDILNQIDFTNPQNTPSSILESYVLTSSSPDFTWTANDLLSIFSSIEKNERMFISKSEPQDVFDHLMSKEVYFYLLQKNGLDKELNKSYVFKRNIRNIILSHTYQKLVAQEVEVTDEMVDDYYTNNKSEFAKPAFRNIELLAFASADDANNALSEYVNAVNDEDIKKIENIMNRYATNEFSKRLINNVYNNGIVPGYGKDTILSTSIWTLPVNEVSDVLITKKNNTPVIFRVVHEQPLEYKPLNHVEPQIKGKLARKLASDKFESLINQYKQEFNFVIYEDKLKPSMSAEKLFDLAEKQAKMGKYNDTILYYDQIIANYANGEDDYKAMFMKGFTYSEYMNNKQKAIETFTSFLNNYPQGDLTDSAQAMLDILTGKTSIEIPEGLTDED